MAGRNRYIGYLISLGMYSFKGMKVGLDCANGSAWNIARLVFEALGAKTYVINNEPDGLNINRNAGSTHIEVLQKAVVDNGLDVGFALTVMQTVACAWMNAAMWSPATTFSISLANICNPLASWRATPWSPP